MSQPPEGREADGSSRVGWGEEDDGDKAPSQALLRSGVPP